MDENTTVLDLPVGKLLDQVSNFANVDLAGIGFGTFFSMMLISLITSLIMMVLYLQFYGSRATGSQIHRSFPLLGLAVTSIFVCIQFSLPLSLGLLGALSIVRFRTPIKEPEEIGFIMVIISSSIAIATLNLGFLAIMQLFFILALLVLAFGPKSVKRDIQDGVIFLTVPTRELTDKSSALFELLEQDLINGRLESITKSDVNSIISYSFKELNNDAAANLQDKISTLLTLKDWSVFFSQRVSL